MVLALVFTAILLTGCGETFNGIGKDINRVGKGIHTVFIRDTDK
jgi:predicted small secreted protein